MIEIYFIFQTQIIQLNKIFLKLFTYIMCAIDTNLTNEIMKFLYGKFL